MYDDTYLDSLIDTEQCTHDGTTYGGAAACVGGEHDHAWGW